MGIPRHRVGAVKKWGWFLLLVAALLYVALYESVRYRPTPVEPMQRVRIHAAEEPTGTGQEFTVGALLSAAEMCANNQVIQYDAGADAFTCEGDK